MYQIEHTQKSRKTLHKLKKDARDRILIALDRLRIHPERRLKRLGNSPFYRFRVGDYRIIIDFQKEVLIVLVIKIDHRKRIYD